jgi:hypothetical protein
MKRIHRKFSDLAKARREAGLTAIKLANGETEALKLTVGDFADYIRACRNSANGSLNSMKYFPAGTIMLSPSPARNSPSRLRM